ncbi:MAG TPA: homoserine O-succinyltransferase [Longimicrobiales bacterium]|nr:homoserine O-succinyltransferase [Longimicrobiales bacterium]
MPLVAHSPLPTFDVLRAQGETILSLDRAVHQDIRELHVGLLNMMPDAALRVTERQFMRLVGSCNQIVQFWVHPFSVPGLGRSDETQAYIDRYYTPFDRLREDGLDALIITGANVASPTLEAEPFWAPLQEVFDWAVEHVPSVLCSCLATHALLKHYHGVDRRRLPRKRWGVYRHRITDRAHPLLRDVNTRFDVPHSRHNEISAEQFRGAGLTVLAESDQGDVHLAVSADQFRVIYLQGHPEYDLESLLKEYVREVRRWLAGEISDPPPYPEHYFSPEAAAVADRYVEAAGAARARGTPAPPFPEAEILGFLDNTWGDSGRAFFNNWLGWVYRLAHVDRHELFMDGVDPHDPLGMSAGG